MICLARTRSRLGSAASAAVLGILLVTALLAFNGCSSVFRGSITGVFEDADSGNGVNDVYVFLYTSKIDFVSDYAVYTDSKSPISFYNKSFTQTTTATSGNNAGTYTFNSVVWDTLLPQFGKDADKREAILVFYNEDYGVTTFMTDVVSDTTIRLTPVKAYRIKDQATIQGTVVDSSSGATIQGVNVNVYVPTSWSYNTDGTIKASSLVWPSSPTYQLTSDNNGAYTRKISWTKMPSETDDRKTTVIRITYTINQYFTDSSVDSRMATDSNWKPNNGEVNNYYYQTDVITDSTTATLPNIAMKHEVFTIRGTVVNKTDGTAIQNVTVNVYVPTDWMSDSSGNIIDASITWPKSPTAQLTTDANGLYTTTVNWPKKVTHTGDDETIKVRITYTLNQWKTDHSVDSDITDDATWQPQGNDKDHYYQSDILGDGSSTSMPDISMQRTAFTVTISGRLWNGNNTTPIGYNGCKVVIYVKDKLGAYPTSGPSQSTYTTQQNQGNGVYKDGYFTLNNVQCYPTDNSGNQNQTQIEIIIYALDNTTVLAAIGLVLDGSAPNGYKFMVIEGANNYIDYKTNDTP